jgi:hypothetical protein
VSLYDTAAFQWQEGERRLREESPDRRHVLDRVVERVLAELRRRLGGPFTTAELVDLYERGGTDWAVDIATRTAPDDPWAWDPRTIADAAFARYLRQATDHAGGRRLGER